MRKIKIKQIYIINHKLNHILKIKKIEKRCNKYVLNVYNLKNFYKIELPNDKI